MQKIIGLALLLVCLAFCWTANADSGSQPGEPTVPLSESLANGQVAVDMGTARNAGYAIGDDIPVILVFELAHNHDSDKASQVDPTSLLADTPTAPVAPPAQELAVPRINIDSLKMGVISSQPSDVEMVKAPVEQVYRAGDKDYVRVVFWVTQYVTCQKNDDGSPKRQVSISADFLYAIDALPDGQPDWQNATTPTMTVDIVPSAGDDQTLMREGDLTPKDSAHSPLIALIAVAGVLMLMPLFAALGLQGYVAYSRPRSLSKNQVFWREVDQVLAQAETAGSYQLEDYQKILYELRRLYGVSTLHTAEVLKALETKPNFKEIELVFSYEEIFFKKDHVVTSEQRMELMDALALIVSRI